MEGRKTRASSKSPGRPKKTKSPARPKSKPKSPARAPSKSPGRPSKKSPARPKSPGRPKSPRRPSPARRTKSPKRPSPARLTKSPKKPSSVRVTKSPRRKESLSRSVSPVKRMSPTRRTAPENSIGRERSSPFVRLERTSAEPPAKRIESFVNEVEISRDRSVSLPKASTSSQSEVTLVYSEETSLLRRSARTRRDAELDKVKSAMNAEVDKILKANNVPLPPQYERKYGGKPVREFGSWPGALFAIVALPALALVLQMSCTKNKCVGVVPPSTNWKVYLDLHTAGYYLGFIVWQALLNSIPLGRKASYGPLQVRLSGFYNLLLTVGVLGALYYYGYNVTAVLSKTVALLSSSILVALLFSLILFFKGGRAKTGRNPNADGNPIYDFFVGREIQPSIGPLNLKALFTRMEFVGIILLDIFYVLKFYETHAAGVHSPTLWFVAIAHLLYVLDTLWFEEKFMTSFQAQYEGVGYMNVIAASVWPFLFALTTRVIVYTNYEAPTYRLVICGIFYVLGYYLYRASNSLKAEYRKDPQNPVFSKYETISTVVGKRLLVDKFWGTIRHPNYLGDILMMWSVASVCGLSHWLPYVFPTLHALILVHRTFRISTRCKTLYGLAWDRYTQIVKYRLVPRVF